MMLKLSQHISKSNKWKYYSAKLELFYKSLSINWSFEACELIDAKDIIVPEDSK